MVQMIPGGLVGAGQTVYSSNDPSKDRDDDGDGRLDALRIRHLVDADVTARSPSVTGWCLPIAHKSFDWKGISPCISVAEYCSSSSLSC